MIRLTVVLGILATGLASGQPRIGWLDPDAQRVSIDGSNPIPSPSPEGLAQGSVFQIHGQGLGPAARQTAESFPLPTNLAGTSVRITAGDTAVDAIMLSAGDGLVRAILPSKTPLGDALVTATFNGQTSATAYARVVRRSFSLYWNASTKLARAHNVNPGADWAGNSFTETARPGQLMVLWGTGLGRVAGDEAAGPLPADLGTADVEVLVGGKRARILYAGRSGCCAGVDQIVLEAPAGAEGCHVPVVVRFPATGEESNYAALAIAPNGGACSAPQGFPPSVMQKWQATGTLNYGWIWIPNGGAIFRREAPGALPSFGSCVPDVWFADYNSGIAPITLDAGPALNFRNSEGTAQWARRPEERYSYQAPRTPTNPNVPQILLPGEYTLDNGQGGPDIGSFQANFTVRLPFSSSFTWTNRDSTKVTASDPIPITWSGADPSRDFVIIKGQYYDYSFTCTESAAKGSLVVPSILLRHEAPGTLSLAVCVQSLPELSPFLASGLDFMELRSFRCDGRDFNP